MPPRRLLHPRRLLSVGRVCTLTPRHAPSDLVVEDTKSRHNDNDDHIQQGGVVSASEGCCASCAFLNVGQVGTVNRPCRVLEQVAAT